MDILEDQGSYTALLLCVSTKVKFLVEAVGISILQNSQGYVTSLTFTDSSFFPTVKDNRNQNNPIVADEAPSCNTFSIKFFEKLTINSTYKKTGIIYCSEQDGKYPYVFTAALDSRQKKMNIATVSINQTVSDCINDASKVLPYEDGFISVKTSTASLDTTSLYQYYQLAPYAPATCTELFSIEDYKFICTHTTEDFSTTYALFNDKAIIKQSYLSNFQVYPLKHLELEMISYALTSNYLYLLYRNENGSSSQIMVYSLKDNFTLIDQI